MVLQRVEPRYVRWQHSFVIGPGGTRLSGVTLDVTTSAAVRHARWVTSEAGCALLPDLHPGVIHVRARRIGFKPGEISARIAVGRNTVPIILGSSTLPALDTVRVVGDQKRSAMKRRVRYATFAPRGNRVVWRGRNHEARARRVMASFRIGAIGRGRVPWRAAKCHIRDIRAWRRAEAGCVHWGQVPNGAVLHGRDG